MKSITGVVVLGAAILALSAFHFNTNPKRGAIPSTVVATFEAWMKEHGVSFSSPREYNYRLSIFAESVKKVNKHNSEGHSYTMGLNKFAHLTFEEFSAKYTGLRVPENREKNEVVVEQKRASLGQNPNLDWRTTGGVNPVKNQGQCGSCWAFSATAAMETANFQSTGTLQDQAEQQLVDCSGSFGNQGCNGGWMDYAFKYIISVNGQMSTSSYPYTAQQGGCSFDASQIVATISGFTDIPQGNCAQLLSSISINPVSVAVAVNSNF